MEENDKNEPKPGYLGNNLEGHEEVFSDKAWSEIETKLAKSKKRRALLWWLSGLGSVVLGIATLVLWVNSNKSIEKNEPLVNLESTIKKNDTAPQQELGKGSKAKAKVNDNQPPTAEFPTIIDKELEKQKGLSQTQNEAKPLQSTKPKLDDPTSNDQRLLAKKQRTEPKSAAKKKAGKDRPLLRAQDSKTRNAVEFGKAIRKKRSTQSREAELKANKLLTIALLSSSDKKLTSEKHIVNQSGLSLPAIGSKPEKSRENSLSEDAFKTTADQNQTLKEVEKNESVISNKPEKKAEESVDKTETSVLNNETVPASNATESIQTKDGLKKSQAVSSLVSDSTLRVASSDSTKKDKLNKSRFWQISVHFGSMSQNVSLEQNTDPTYQFYRFQTNQKLSKPIYSALRISYFWQIHQAFSLGVRLSYSVLSQKMRSNLDPARYAPSLYKLSDDGSSIIAYAEYQNDQTLFTRTSHMLDPGLVAMWKPSWSPIGIQMAFQGLGLNLKSGHNLIEGKTYRNFQIQSGLFLPIGERFQIQAEAFYVKSNDYYLPLPVPTKGNGWIASIGVAWKL